ncbi:MAG: VOC family protein [Vicinamibacterales bacterium]
MNVDHVIVAGVELESMRVAFTAAGLPAAFGGVHAHGTTHMAIVPFADGSYFELLAPVRPDVTPVRWREHLAAGIGPCGWAVRVDDLAAETRRLQSAGVPVDAPMQLGRQRPDGCRAEWKVAFVGHQPLRSVLPFLIEDTTDRERRVHPGGMTPAQVIPRRISFVVLGVRSIADSVALFRRTYGWPSPRLVEDEFLDATLAAFDGSPVVLAQGRRGSWLEQRTVRHGETPCAVGIGRLDESAIWGRHSMRWEQVGGTLLAFCGGVGEPC